MLIVPPSSHRVFTAATTTTTTTTTTTGGRRWRSAAVDVNCEARVHCMHIFRTGRMLCLCPLLGGGGGEGIPPAAIPRKVKPKTTRLPVLPLHVVVSRALSSLTSRTTRICLSLYRSPLRCRIMAYLLRRDDRAHALRHWEENESVRPIGVDVLGAILNALHRTTSSPPAAARAAPHSPVPARTAPGSPHTQACGTPFAMGSNNCFPTVTPRTTSTSSVAASASSPVADAELFLLAMDNADLAAVVRTPLMATTPTPTILTTASGDGTTAADTGLRPFRRIAHDRAAGITIYSTAVPDCPVHMARAIAIMPGNPAEVLQAMDSTMRPAWDSYVSESRRIRCLSPPPSAADETRRRCSAALAIQSQQHRPRKTSMSTGGGSPCPAVAPRSAASPPGTVPPAPEVGAHVVGDGFDYRPGQCRVAEYYLAVKSPVMLVQDRDFELCVREEILSDGTAIMKAFSLPMGQAVPLDPSQTRYVRGLVLLSGLVALPLTVTAFNVNEVLPPALREGAKAQLRHAASGSITYAYLDYFGLVHPMGLLPPMFANMVIHAQTSTLKRLQEFLMQARARGHVAAQDLSPLSSERTQRRGGVSSFLSVIGRADSEDDDEGGKVHGGDRARTGNAVTTGAATPKVQRSSHQRPSKL